MILFKTHAYAFMKTRMMQFATGPTHEKDGGIFIGNGAAIFMVKKAVGCGEITGNSM